MAAPTVNEPSALPGVKNRASALALPAAAMTAMPAACASATASAMAALASTAYPLKLRLMTVAPAAMACSIAAYTVAAVPLPEASSALMLMTFISPFSPSIVSSIEVPCPLSSSIAPSSIADPRLTTFSLQGAPVSINATSCSTSPASSANLAASSSMPPRSATGASFANTESRVAAIAWTTSS